jgi:hypothetical protein
VFLASNLGDEAFIHARLPAKFPNPIIGAWRWVLALFSIVLRFNDSQEFGWRLAIETRNYRKCVRGIVVHRTLGVATINAA